MITKATDIKMQTCNQCEHNVYDVKPNFNVCDKANNISITIVIQQESCPIGKW
jgi:hypothetical protein